IGKGGRNWITRTAPGNRGQLPAYIQNIRNAIMRDGKPESTATAIAIGTVKRWAKGIGNVSATVKAAAAKAVAEWLALRGKSKARKVAKAVGRAVAREALHLEVHLKGGRVHHKRIRGDRAMAAREAKRLRSRAGVEKVL